VTRGLRLSISFRTERIRIKRRKQLVRPCSVKRISGRNLENRGGSGPLFHTQIRLETMSEQRGVLADKQARLSGSRLPGRHQNRRQAISRIADRSQCPFHKSFGLAQHIAAPSVTVLVVKGISFGVRTNILGMDQRKTDLFQAGKPAGLSMGMSSVSVKAQVLDHVHIGNHRQSMMRQIGDAPDDCP